MTVLVPPVRAAGHRTRSWRPLAGAAATGLVTLWAASYPDLPFSWALFSAAGFVVTGVLIVSGLAKASRRRAAMGASVGAVALLAIALTVALLPARPAFHARFDASLPAYASVVAQAGEPDLAPFAEDASDGGFTWGKFNGTCPARIGLFWVAECRTFPAGYLFLQPENSFGDDSGVAYVPYGIPDSEESGVYPEEFTHVQGPWYVWRCGC